MLIVNIRGMSIGYHSFIRDGARLEVVDRINHLPGKLTIGNDVHIEQNVHIVACGEITIGDHVVIAAGVSILDSAHPIGYPGDGNRVKAIEPGDAYVHIESRAFIGVGTVILRNVTIGANSIIGAGSVVVKDIPANCIAAGSPARVIRGIRTERPPA
jgi:acetyltransferase-like isoleucine patch superfamily enzyme